MNHKTHLVQALAFVAWPLLFDAAQAQSQCDEILKQGVRNSYLLESRKDVRQEYERSFCQSHSGTDTSNRGVEFGLIGQSKIDFFGNDDEAQTVAQQSCDNSSNKLSDDGFTKLMQYTVDPQIVRAWSECTSSQAGPFILGELNGSDLFITYKFRPTGSISTTEVIADPFISGATCQQPPIVKVGTIIHGGGKTEACKRDGDGPVSVVFNTEFGSARFYIPAKPVPVAKPAQTVPGKPGSPWSGQSAGGPNAAGQFVLQSGAPRPRPGKHYCVCKTPSSSKWGGRPMIFEQNRSSGACKCEEYGPVPGGVPEPPKGSTRTEILEWYDRHHGPVVATYEGEVAKY